MNPPDCDTIRQRSSVSRVVSDAVVLLVTLALVVSVAAPAAAGLVTGQQVQQTDAGGVDGQSAAPQTGDEQWTTPPLSMTQAENTTVDEEKRNAATAGVDEAVDVLQRQGVSVNQSQRAAAVDGAVAAVAQHQNASVEQVQNATVGATTGTFLQSQNVSVAQVQNATFGGGSGALSQHQNASATQLQHAAYGATHGAVAQRQNASVEQVQLVAQGAAAGAAHEAGKRERNDSKKKAHPGSVREAAQGAAFGALVQQQDVTVEQRQSAAVGAAEGALAANQSVNVTQRQVASVKQVQVAAMGAAEGALSVSQDQEVTVEQVQAAARGACKGSLTQVQNVTVTQIQEAAKGAAGGAISQSQTASVTQIQAAATGGAEGVVVQKQVVNVVQVQHAAAGAAKGAARSAAQNQVVNVRQIQAAAAGAGQGSVVQIQQVNVVQVQVIAESAAGGALSQSQTASVTQIQSAARGACEGALSLSQRQEISITQIQVIAGNAASDTAATAAEINVDVDVTIVDYAKGAAQDPSDGGDEGEDGEEERLRSLFASADGESVYLANPNDVAVTVTLTSQDGDAETRTLAAGESQTLELDRGTYTLTAETSDGRDVEISGRDELTLSVGDELQSLEASVDERVLTVTNPNDERVTVEVTADGEQVTTFEVPADWEVSEVFDPGTYTLTAQTEGGETVPVEDGESHEFTVDPGPIDLGVSVDEGNVTVENPSDADVTVTLTGEDDEEQSVDVAADESVTTTVEPGTYAVTGETAADREVLVEGESETEVTVEAPAVEPVDLTVTVDEEAITFENPNETAVTVTASNDTGERTVDVPGEETVTESFAAGEYVLTGSADEDRPVVLNGEEELDVNVTAPAPEPVDLNVSTGVENLTVENPGETDVTVTAASDAGENRTVDVPAGEEVTEGFDPGTYTLTGESEDGRDVRLDNETALTVEVEERELESVNATVQNETLEVTNPNGVPVSITLSGDEDDETFDVGPGENHTEPVQPGDYEVTAETDDGTQVPVNDEDSWEFAITAPAPTTATLDVGDQTGNGSTVALANATAPVEFYVQASYDDAVVESQTFDAGTVLENASLPLEPPLDEDALVEVTLRTADTDAELANATVQFDVTDEAATETPTATETPENVTETPTPNETTTPTETESQENVTETPGNVTETPTETPAGPNETAPDETTPNETDPDETETPSNVTGVPAVESPTETSTETEIQTDAETATETDTPTETETPTPTDTETPTPTETPAPTPVEPEPGVEFVNCTTAQVNGTYDRLGVTLGYYDSAGNQTGEYAWTAVDVPGDRPVNGTTLVTVGETNETRTTEDGTLLVQIADPGAFGEDAGSFVAHVNTSASPDGDQDLAVSQPASVDCRDDVRPEPPTMNVDSVSVQDNESALVELSYENPNDAPLVPAQSLFTGGTVVEESPAALEPGENVVTVEWTPATPEENLVWTANLSNFGLENVTATGPTASELPGLLEPPTETPDEGPADEPTDGPTDEPADGPAEAPAETPTDESDAGLLG